MTATSRTPASVLQEFCVHRKITPVYEIDDDNSPTHLKKFICQVTCDTYTAIGEGRSKKEAKHAAAEKMLKIIRPTDEPLQSPNTATVPSPYEGKVKEDSVGPLTDFCTELGIKAPEYVHTRAEGPPHATMFTFRCTVGSFHTEAIERTKQQAKQLAAMYMLNRLKKMVDPRIKLQLPEVSFIDPSQEPNYRKASTMLTNGNFSEFKKILVGNLTHPLSSDFMQFRKLFRENFEFFEEIKTMVCDYNDENALEILVSILEKADYKYALIPVESACDMCSVILNIDCNPNLNVLETGSCYVEACNRVAAKTLNHMKILSFSKHHCVEIEDPKEETIVSEEQCVENGEPREETIVSKEQCVENEEPEEETIDFETLINVKKKSC
ncbi:RISC-loading complex subunit tarbp2-like [Planococcus citri]|uniref:RISC-loading complex subunit tarbp2-like n=1 Tax=Planococcus citri TaxID=170843 RepID=UPI0031F96651